MIVAPALAVVLILACLALAAGLGGCGGSTVTARRAAITPAVLGAALAQKFNRLTILQQQELGRTVPRGATLKVIPTCIRHASNPSGPGDWVCTLYVNTPDAGRVPVSYDVTVQADGCYKAQGSPSIVGSRLMKDAAGKTVVNPLYTIYGCSDG